MSINIFRYLTDDGLTTGERSMVVNGGTTPVPYYAGPAAGEVWDIHRMLVYIEDGSASASTYGGISALTNGLTLKTTTGGLTGATNIDVLDGHPIAKNSDWSGTCYDLNITSPGQGNSIVSVRWTFSKGGAPLTLVGHKSEKFVATINDAMAGLVEHHIMIQGVEYAR